MADAELGEDASGSREVSRIGRVPDLVRFMATVEVPMNALNQKMFLNLFLFALVG